MPKFKISLTTIFISLFNLNQAARAEVNCPNGYLLVDTGSVRATGDGRGSSDRKVAYNFAVESMTNFMFEEMEKSGSLRCMKNSSHLGREVLVLWGPATLVYEPEGSCVQEPYYNRLWHCSEIGSREWGCCVK